jgi:hypothetical protein
MVVESLARKTDDDGGELLIPLAFDPSGEGNSSRGHSPSPDRQYGANDYPRVFENWVLADIHGLRVRPCVSNSPDKVPLPISDSSKLAKAGSARSSSDIPSSFRETSNYSGPTRSQPFS